jgi:glycosyltransferase involved in cell wall biosynthesis
MTGAEEDAGLAVSVVVPTLDRPARAAAVVRALLSGDEVPVEILVVDQSEDDRTARALAGVGDGRVHRLAHQPPSTSGARNAGARAAGGDYVAFLDDDVEFAASWLASVRAELRALGLPDAIFGEVHEPEGFVADRTHLPVSLFHIEEARVWEKPLHPNRVGYAANFVCRRAVFLEVGGFDPRLGPGTRFCGAEDMDLAYRLLKGGYRVASSPRFQIVHQQWREPEVLPRLFYGYNVGGAAFCAKHLRAGDARAALFLLVQVRDDAKMFASALKRRSLLRARVAAARTVGTWSGLARGLRSLGSGASPKGPGTSPGSPPAGGS